MRKWIVLTKPRICWNLLMTFKLTLEVDEKRRWKSAKFGSCWCKRSWSWWLALFVRVHDHQGKLQEFSYSAWVMWLLTSYHTSHFWETVRSLSILVEVNPAHHPITVRRIYFAFWNATVSVRRIWLIYQKAVARCHILTLAGEYWYFWQYLSRYVASMACQLFSKHLLNPWKFDLVHLITVAYFVTTWNLICQSRLKDWKSLLQKLNLFLNAAF